MVFARWKFIIFPLSLPSLTPEIFSHKCSFLGIFIVAFQIWFRDSLHGCFIHTHNSFPDLVQASPLHDLAVSAALIMAFQMWFRDSLHDMAVSATLIMAFQIWFNDIPFMI
jgi:hypothetical protein